MTDQQAERSSQHRFLLELARAFAGSLLFSFPILMTMEMWHFGMVLDRRRLALFVAVSLPLVTAFTRYLGFRSSRDPSWLPTLVDAAVTLLVGAVASMIMLTMFGVLSPASSLNVTIPTIAIQMIPASIGAAFARQQIGDAASQDLPGGYWGELLVMVMGATVLSLNVAPTEEMLLIGVLMNPWHLIVLAATSLALLHAIVFALQFRGQHEIRGGVWEALLRYTLGGYLVALGVSAFLLWVFGRLDSVGLEAVLAQILVLGFPATLGAAAARIVL